MAVKFTAANSDYLENTSSTAKVSLADWPVSISLWFNHAGGAGTQGFVGVFDSGDPDYMFSLWYNGGDVNGLQQAPSGGFEAINDDGVTANKWHNAVAVFETGQLRRVYLDGSEGDEEETLVAEMGTMDVISIGRRGDSTPSHYLDGQIAEVGLWRGTITADEAKMLADGYAPSMIQTDNLKHYYDLIADYKDSVTSSTPLDLIAGGTPSFVEHPPGIVYPPERIRLDTKRRQRRERIA